TEQETALNPVFAVERNMPRRSPRHLSGLPRRSPGWHRTTVPGRDETTEIAPPASTLVRAAILIQAFEVESDLTAFLQQWRQLEDDAHAVDGMLIALTTYPRPVE